MLIYEHTSLRNKMRRWHNFQPHSPLQSLLHFSNSCTAFRCMGTIPNSSPINECLNCFHSFTGLSWYVSAHTCKFCTSVGWIPTSGITGSRLCALLMLTDSAKLTSQKRSVQYIVPPRMYEYTDFFPHPHWQSIKTSDLCQSLNWRNLDLYKY